MKKLLAVVSLLSLLLLSGCGQVEPGYVGIKVNLLGSDKGVSSEELPVGRYWIGINEDLYLFPTFTQTQVWTQVSTEGSPNDDSITFQSNEGLSVNTDVSIMYHVDPSKATILFEKFRNGIDAITHSYLRNLVRDALIREGSKLTIEEIYSSKKSELMLNVLRTVKSEAHESLIIENISWAGDLRLPDSIVNAINSKVTSMQHTLQLQNELEQTKATVAKDVETARGEAQAAEFKAQAVKSQAEALQGHPEVVALKAIEKWDGHYPTTLLSDTAMPLIKINDK